MASYSKRFSATALNKGTLTQGQESKHDDPIIVEENTTTTDSKSVAQMENENFVLPNVEANEEVSEEERIAEEQKRLEEERIREEEKARKKEEKERKAREKKEKEEAEAKAKLAAKAKKKIPINIYVEKEELDQIDKKKQDIGMNRNQFILFCIKYTMANGADALKEYQDLINKYRF